MEFMRAGQSGLELSKVTFGSALTIGTEHVDQVAADDLVGQAWELGVRSFDTANSYGAGAAEVLISRALRHYPRDEFVIATKAFHPMGSSPYHKGLSRKHVMWALRCSLERMELDYIDVFYAHRFDPMVPMEEIVRTYNDLIRSGRVLYWATSEWPTEALVECHRICDALGFERPIIEQPIYSYAVRKIELNGVLELCKNEGVGVLGFSPLCQGLLTGKYRKGVPADSRIAKSASLGYRKTANFMSQYAEQVEYFLDVCDEFSLRPSSTALNWCLRRGVMPVLGASKPSQLVDSLSDLERPVPDAAWSKLELMLPAY